MEQAVFCESLRQLRLRAGLTLEALAEASGVSVRAIGDMERGRSVPRQSTLSELMDVLALDEEERRALVDAARGGASRKARHTPRQLPPDLRTFRGRKDLLARVQQLTAAVHERAGHVLITAVGGMGGVGKTTLAVHWAHRVADRFPDGQLYVNLRGFDPSGTAADPAEVLGGFLTALGVAARSIPDELEERSALFREQVAKRRLIVVLDNARDSGQVRPLLPGSAGCLTVITSRNHLTGLAAKDEAHLIDLDLWTRDEAVEALAARIGSPRVAADPESAGELVELCGHLPLAVAILGAHLAAEPATSLRVAVHELTQAHSRLDVLTTDDPHADVRAVFSWSYNALEPTAARFFRLLAVLPGPVFSAEAAASATGEPMPTARRLLRTLTAASLLTRDAEGNFVLHDLMRAHAMGLLEQGLEDRFAAELRLLDYLRHNVRAARSAWDTRPVSDLDQPAAAGVVLIPFDSREQSLAWFQQEERTIVAALRAADDPRLLHFRLRLATDCVSYFSARGQWADEIAMQRLALDAALLLDDPGGISDAAASLARALAQTRRWDEADLMVDLMERQLDRVPRAYQGHTHRSVGWVRGRQGRHAEALDHAHRALAIYRAVGDPNLIARELNAVGWYLALLGRYREAVTTCQEALLLLQETGNRFSEAATWDSIGYALYRSGELREAVSHLQTSAQIYDELLNHYNHAEVLDHLAEAQLAMGERDAARASWLLAAEKLDTIKDPRATGMRARARTIPDPPAGSSCAPARASEAPGQ